MLKLKRLSIIMLLIFLVPLVGISSQDTAIVFRNIPWGSTYSDTMSKMADTNTSWERLSPATGRKTTINQITENGIEFFEFDTYAYTYTSYNSSQIMVAGYKTSSITLYFAYSVDENGGLPMDQEHTQFYLAKYKFEPTDLVAMTADLKNKLSSLYGEVKFTESDNMVIDNHYYIWTGSDNTVAVLQSEEYPTGSKYIYVWYGWMKADEIRNVANSIQFEEARAEEMKNFGLDNTDGL